MITLTVCYAIRRKCLSLLKCYTMIFKRACLYSKKAQCIRNAIGTYGWAEKQVLVWQGHAGMLQGVGAP